MDPTRPSEPWWRQRMMWLVVGGPLAVIVAGFATLFIALANPDPVLPTAPAQANPSATPAVQGRNHVTTPTPAAPK